MDFKAVIEGLLFVSGEQGLSLEEICNITEKNKDEVSLLIKELFNDYNYNSRGIQLEFLGNKFKLTTKPEHKIFYKKMIKEEENLPLSQSVLETLAIIAYNAPITRAEIDNIRGVNSAYIIRKLLIRGLIEEIGKSDAPGKPKIYNITQSFLDYFGLGTISELPKLNIDDSNNDINNENDLFKSKYSE